MYNTFIRQYYQFIFHNNFLNLFNFLYIYKDKKYIHIYKY